MAMSGTGYVNNSFGQQNAINAKPPAAGLNIFCPKPPKHCLTIDMLNTLATIGTYKGTLAGISNPIITPVTIEEISGTIKDFFLIEISSVSKTKQVKTETKITSNALEPKYKKDKTTKNIIAINTSDIITLVVSDDLICGRDSINKLDK